MQDCFSCLEMDSCIKLSSTRMRKSYLFKPTFVRLNRNQGWWDNHVGCKPAQQIGLFTALDQLHLLADERFNSQEKLVAHYEELKEILRENFQSETDEILKRLSDNDVLPQSRDIKTFLITSNMKQTKP